MQNNAVVVSFEKLDKERFLKFLRKNTIRHVFVICDLLKEREKTKIWAAQNNGRFDGYLFEFDKRIIHTHGKTENMDKLLQYTSLEEATIVIEPHHLAKITGRYEPVAPTDVSSKGKITTYHVMKATAQSFNPLIRHKTKRLCKEDIGEVLKNFGQEWAQRIANAVDKGIAYGAYENDILASTATVTEIVDNIALIRGVQTIPSQRDKGLATSAVSAITKELISLDKDAILWVSKDNMPAIRVYEKIGFQKTEYTLLSFKARRLNKRA